MKTAEGDHYIIPSNVPAFLVKLWKLVEDPQYDMHISWNRIGSGFLVHDQATFAREILPKYFKHNNFASFVRQLNMYGFRKVIGAEQGGLRSDNDVWEFHNPNFQCGQPQLLENVKRKAAPEEKKMKNEDVAKVLNEVQDMKGKQDEMTAKLDQMKRENETLWRELVDLRSKHTRQQTIVNRLFQFLMRLVYQNESRLANRKRLMIQDSSEQEQAAKRARQEYAAHHTVTRSPTSSGPSPAYSSPGPSTQTLTISDVSNTPNGPFITDLPDDEDISRRVASAHRPVIVLHEDSSNRVSPCPIVESPVTTQGPSYHTSPPVHTTGVVTFPEEHPQQQPSVIHPSHIVEPVHYEDSPGRRVLGLSRQYSEEDGDGNRNSLGEHIDYISANLDSLQQVLQNQQTLLDASGFGEFLTSNSDPSFSPSSIPSQQDLLDAIADRAVPSPMPPAGQHGHELVQYGQGPSNMQRPMRHREQEIPGYGRKAMAWSPGTSQQQQQYEAEGNQRSPYDVQELFNG
ncbi:heat shock factor protein isoform X2 [Nematostella vectensis]|uniref:heat shock factor protein isoform X2 n=1 Tax=Nematostella vectensis TaxID=45351 RepID=UPI002076FB49|nr:heat shock factor protein isoform X2 [Nematostella vectensis]